ncbi:MAG: indole-3-glycerol-phosphate synthase [Syntrophaceae bacterium]
MDFLAEMYGRAKQRAAQLKIVKEDDYPLRPFKPVLHDMAVIAEVKYATPAEGNLGITAKPGVLARQYADLGAKAISCLTEPHYFSGDLAFIPKIRRRCGLPVLMKDFIVDERQIVAGRASGADACLLITELLSSGELAALYHSARDQGMDVLVEVHGPEGLEKALAIGARIIGVNSRDLATLKVRPEHHEDMIGLIPTGVITVAESGITSGIRLKELRSMGYDAALIGRAMADEAFRKDIFACG